VVFIIVAICEVQQFGAKYCLDAVIAGALGKASKWLWL